MTDQGLRFRVWIDAQYHDPKLKIFGLTPLERHLKALNRHRHQVIEIAIDSGGKARPAISVKLETLSIVHIDDMAGSAAQRLDHYRRRHPNDIIVALDAIDVIDARLYAVLAAARGIVRAVGEDQERAVLKIEGNLPELAQIASADLGQLAAGLHKSGLARDLTQDEFPTFIARLRRHQPYYILRAASIEAKQKIERFLFWSNYKGSTDFFTKYVYPPLVWILVRPLARWRVHPNLVTGLSILMTFAAVPLFAQGYFWAGLALAYGMSVLDSVDGKLARLTFTDSKWGNILDHGLDIVHPPLWYLGWAAGLTGGATQHPLVAAAWLMTGFYILDRFVLSIYKTYFGRGLHTHAPIDGWMRTFISRRNINLPLFTAGLAVGLAVESFYLIVGWQIATVLYHAGRTGWILAFDRKRAAVA